MSQQLIYEAQRQFTRHAIMCPGTEDEINHLDCYFCPANCIHHEDAVANLYIDAMKHPDKYPDWLYLENPFRRIRRMQR